MNTYKKVRTILLVGFSVMVICLAAVWWLFLRQERGNLAAWDRAQVQRSGSSVVVHFSSGMDECYRESVEIERVSADEAVVKLYIAEKAGLDTINGRTCPAIAVAKSLTVQVDPPLAPTAVLTDPARRA